MIPISKLQKGNHAIVSHTSIYLDDSSWLLVPGCLNISLPFCNVSVLIDDLRDFTTKIVLRIEARENGVISDHLQVTLYPDRHVHLSAPTMHVAKVTETFLGVNLLGPESPYYDLAQNEKPLRVEEAASNLKRRIYFLVELDGPNIKMSQNTTAMFPYVEFSQLTPGLSYNISAVTSYRGIFETTYSKRRTIKKVFTTLSDTLHRPVDVELAEESAINCSHPDLRDVLVTWRRPKSAKPITFYDLRFWTHDRKEKAKSYTIRSEVNRTNYSFLLRNLPRWSQIEVIVFANTTFTGCASFNIILFPHSVDDGSSRPENLSFVTNSPDSGIIVWNPPSSCKECIVGYEVSWKLSEAQGTGNASKDTVPPNELQYKLKKKRVADVTLVAVTTLLISGDNMHKTGQQAVLDIQLKESGDIINFYMIIAICLGVLVVSTMLLLILFYKAIKKRRRKDEPTIKAIFSMKKNGSELCIPRPPMTSSVQYSRSIYVREPEIFDELLPIPSSE
ncbi:hypothetical protein BSL78_27854 [Apostichopus japonicus]|uniref:Fibronectin type-III domain-containing protein n=1 Tax=Stichopus japonicus TaxID=307972 RepID=A0A2G8JHV1_STIJA|nr:hypothetical protein BSL78_27854 [Apostichopus japonicus]